MDTVVRVRVVPNEVAADVVCTFLRAEGIRCAHRVTNVGAGSWDGVPNVGGAREILVAEPDLERALAILAAADEGDFVGDADPST